MAHHSSIGFVIPGVFFLYPLVRSPIRCVRVFVCFPCLLWAICRAGGRVRKKRAMTRSEWSALIANIFLLCCVVAKSGTFFFFSFPALLFLVEKWHRFNSFTTQRGLYVFTAGWEKCLEEDGPRVSSTSWTPGPEMEGLLGGVVEDGAKLFSSPATPTPTPHNHPVLFTRVFGSHFTWISRPFYTI